MIEYIEIGFLPSLWILILALLAIASTKFFRLLRLPEFLGALTAGVVLGPSVLNLVGAAEQGIAWEIETRALGVFYWCGLSVLMFMAGNSITFSSFNRFNAKIWILAASALAVLIPAFATAGLVIDIAGGVQSMAAKEALSYRMVITLCAVVTSVPFLTKILYERGLLRTHFAKTLLLAACIVDLVLWLALSVVHRFYMGDILSLEGFFYAAAPNLLVYTGTLILIVSMRASTGRLKTMIPTSARAEFAFGAGILTIVVSIATIIGGELMIAALCAGMVHANCRWLNGRDKLIWQRVEFGIVPLYFAAIGVSLTLGGTFSLWQVVVFLLWSSALKIGFVRLVLEMFKKGDPSNTAYSVAMNTRGGPGIAMASFAFAAGMVNDTTFITLIISSFVTAFMTDFYINKNTGVIKCHA